MRAYQTDNLGYYVGHVNCQPNPMEEGKYLIPAGAILKQPPEAKENEIAFWNGENWEIVPDFSKKIYFSVNNPKERKIFQTGEVPGNDYTDIEPPKESPFHKFVKGEWKEDSKEKQKYENELKVFKARQLLADSDWTQTLDNQKKRGQKFIDDWASYREQLRAIQNNPSKFTEFPKEPSDK